MNDSYYKTHLSYLEGKNLRRSVHSVSGPTGPIVTYNGREILMFSSNNYLGLASHPEMIKNMGRAAEKYGVGSGASRLVSGTSDIHTKLEKSTAEFKHTEACLLFNSGYQANLGIIPAIVRKGSVIFSDELNHASLIDGIHLSKARVHIYPHRDMAILENKLSGISDSTGQKWIITDTIFSMDGDIAPLIRIKNLAEKYNAFIYLDEAHATGIRGPQGRGMAHESGIAKAVTIQMGTFSKAMGSFGAYAAGSKEIIDYLTNTVRSFIFSTSLPPGVAAANNKAIELVKNGDDLRTDLYKNVDYFKTCLREQGWSIGPTDSHIIPLIIGEAALTMEISSRLLELGVWAQGIRPPSVPSETARLRLTPMASHTRAQLNLALDQFEKVYKEFSNKITM